MYVQYYTSVCSETVSNMLTQHINNIMYYRNPIDSIKYVAMGHTVFMKRQRHCNECTVFITVEQNLDMLKHQSVGEVTIPLLQN